ncbi:MAG: iron ABC transporter permease [Chloroflexi bacterium]|nr:iron ABC transporter permease [Chloroflexota bacterium]
MSIEAPFFATRRSGASKMIRAVPLEAAGRALASQERPIMLVCAAIVSVLILLPLAMLVRGSFMVEAFGQEAAYSFQNYATFLSEPRLLRSLGNTVQVCLGATVLAGVLGVTLAWLAARTDTPLRGALEPWTLVPFFLSPFLGALAWSYLAAPRVGMLNVTFSALFGTSTSLINLYTVPGVIWVHGMFFTPVVYLFVIGGLRRMDPSLEEVGRISGSGVLGTLGRVTLPLALPGILSALILVLVSSAGEFGVPLVLLSPHGAETLTTQIYALVSRTPADYNLSAAIGSVLLIAAFVFLFIQRRIILPREFTTISGRGYRPARVKLGRWRWAALAFRLLYVLLAVALPLLALLLVALSRSWQGSFDPSSATLNNFGYVLGNKTAQSGVKNSFLLAISGATLAMVLATAVAYLVYRSRLRGRSLLDFITIAPIGVPDIVMAMGVLLAFIRTPLYGTIWLLLVGYIARFMPYGQRSLVSVLLSLSPVLEEASRVAGASWLGTLRRIAVPLLRPGLLAGWMLMFIIFFREFSISVLLYREGIESLSVAVFRFLEYENAPRTATLALCQAIVLLLAQLGFSRLWQSDRELL